MGMIWRSIMPLLSTLAALVILVHSAEEETEHHELGLRSRSVDTQDYDYDQAWRTLRNESIVQKSDEWNGPPSPQEDPPRRRKTWRKRKRRPMLNQETTRDSNERRHYHGEPARHIKPDYPIIPENQENLGPMKKRKKRPEIRSWVKEEQNMERPLRRRGQRRKRPNLKNFTHYEPELRPLDVVAYNYDDEKLHKQHDEVDHYQNYEAQGNQSYIVELSSTELQPNEMSELSEDIINIKDREEDQNTQAQHDLSVPGSTQEENGSIMKVNDNEEPGQMLTREELEEARNPVNLKELLKKSNGGSLSEILQQNNLSLTDLLQGDRRALKLLKTKENSQVIDHKNPNRVYKYNARENFNESEEDNLEENISNKTIVDENTTEPIAVEITYIYNTTDKITTNVYSSNNTDLTKKEENLNKELQTQSEILDTKEDAPKIIRKRPFFPKGRRKLRLRISEINNNTQKYSANKKRQLQNNIADLKELNTVNDTMNVDMSHNNKTIEKKYVKPIAYEEILPNNNNNDNNNFEKNGSFTTMLATTTVELTTIPVVIAEEETNNVETTTTTNDIPTFDSNTNIIHIDVLSTTTEKAIVTPMQTTKLNNSELRRQALTNRLKRKRLKQKMAITELPRDDVARDLFGMANLVSASEFIAKTQSPITTKTDDIEATLTDFFATEASTKIERPHLTPQFSVASTVVNNIPIHTTTTEKTAKIEIAEILNDYDTNARLSKILMERNMTINELVEHRERGSSNVHLADIFHNTSREPNPPEPFLSKSSIEPISKGTYPLRALLEANQHESATKPISVEELPYQAQMTDMPVVVMDYGHNVNENGENLGIMSLFDNLTTNHFERNDYIKTDSDGTPYVTSIMNENITNNDNTRSGRDLDHKSTIAGGLTELFVYMQRKYNDGNKEITETLSRQQDPTATETILPATTEDENRLMILEDLQHLKEFNSNIASDSDEDIEVKMVENQETTTTDQPGLLDKIPSGTKSVTVVTASIVGLTMIVFLMTYLMFKWKQQRSLINKKASFSEERIPTPVFESRKANKIQNSIRSTRSISPMLSTSNIYTLNTLDSRNGTESPEYMWDSLRKPFQ